MKRLSFFAVATGVIAVTVLSSMAHAAGPEPTEDICACETKDDFTEPFCDTTPEYCQASRTVITTKTSHCCMKCSIEQIYYNDVAVFWQKQTCVHIGCGDDLHSEIGGTQVRISDVLLTGVRCDPPILAHSSDHLSPVTKFTLVVH